MRSQKGFTLVEIVIAIALVIMITAVVTQGLGPWIKFKQRLETEQNLRDLVQGTTALYKANAFTIDDADPDGPIGPIVGPNGLLALDPTLPAPLNQFRTDCQAGDPADTTSMQETLRPLQSYLAKSAVDLARDGFNNKICVLVSKRQFRDVNGTRLFYHSVAFISPGDNNVLDAGTNFVDNGTSMTLTLAGDDTGQMVDGFKISLENYQTTVNRLQKLASSYETYFHIRFLTKADRDISINYFYGNTGSNNGDPGDPANGDPGPSAPETRPNLGGNWALTSFDNVIDVVTSASGANRFSAVLGVGDAEGRDAWGRPLLVDNRSQRVKSGELNGVKTQPPYSASFGALLPGTSSVCGDSPNSPGSICLTYISANSVGKY